MTSTISKLLDVYDEKIKLGIIDIIVPPDQLYADIDEYLNKTLSENAFNDNFSRYKWRVKQSYDYAYIMSYALDRGKYYLQLEDDVICANGFVEIIKNKIKFENEKSTNNKWIMIEFSRIGFIGKLFKTEKLPLFINFFILFAYDMPVDWLLDKVFTMKNCYYEKVFI